MWRFRFLVDDAFISFRYGANWVAGLGLRFNPGEEPPVEGYSNFLWVLWSGVVQRLGGDATVWVPVSSFLLGTGLLYWVFTTMRHRIGTSLDVALLATLSLGAFPPFAVWSTGGLATVPCALAAFVTFRLLVLRLDDPAPVAAGCAGIALVLLRIEGVVWALSIGVAYALACWIRRREGGRPRWPLRTALVYVAIVITGFAVYTGFRRAYYGAWFPNTVVAKISLEPAALSRGWDYVVVYHLTFLTPLLVIPAAFVGCLPGRREVALPALAVVAAVVGGALAAGGDFMAMGRFFVLGLPFAALLFALLLERARARWWSPNGRRLVAAAGLVAVGIGLLPAADLHLVPEGVRSRHHFRLNVREFRSELEQWDFMRQNTLGWSALGRAARRFSEPGDSAVLGTIGAVGFYSGLVIYDTAGLVTPEVAARGVASLRSPGHDKAVLPSYFLRYQPTFLHMELVNRHELDSTAQRLIGWSDGLASSGHFYAPEVRGIGNGEWFASLHRVEDEPTRARAAGDLRTRVPIDRREGRARPPGRDGRSRR